MESIFQGKDFITPHPFKNNRTKIAGDFMARLVKAGLIQMTNKISTSEPCDKHRRGDDRKLTCRS